MSKLKDSPQLDNYGCIMLRVDIPSFKTYQEAIHIEDLMEDGLELNPHITLLYGLTDNISMEEISKITNDFVFDVISLPQISCFNTEDSDVLKFEVDSDMLQQLNNKLATEFTYWDNYSTYEPHVTIAYLNKGAGKDYMEIFKGMSAEAQPKDIWYNTIEDEDIYLPIESNSEGITEEIIYSMVPGLTVSPTSQTWINSQNDSAIEGKADYYGNGAAGGPNGMGSSNDELTQFQAGLFRNRDTRLVYDGTINTQRSNPLYSTDTMGESEEVLPESVVTTSSNIANPAPAVLSADRHNAEQRARIGSVLQNFDVKGDSKKILHEDASNYSVEVKPIEGDYIIKVTYLTKSYGFKYSELVPLKDELLDTINEGLFNAFAQVADEEDIKMLPEIATYIEDKIHDISQKALVKESLMETTLIEKLNLSKFMQYGLLDMTAFAEYLEEYKDAPEYLPPTEDIFLDDAYVSMSPEELFDVEDSIALALNQIVPEDATPEEVVDRLMGYFAAHDADIPYENTRSVPQLSSPLWEGTASLEKNISNIGKQYDIIASDFEDDTHKITFTADTTKKDGNITPKEFMNFERDLSQLAGVKDVRIDTYDYKITVYLGESQKGKNMNKTKLVATKLAEAEEVQAKENNMLSNPQVAQVVRVIYEQRSQFGEDYEFLSPNEVARMAQEQGFELSYNEIASIAYEIKDLVEGLELDTLGAVDFDMQAALASTPKVDAVAPTEELPEELESATVLKGKGVEVKEAKEHNKTVERWAKELGKPYSEIHKYWLKAEKEADKKLPKKDYWKEVNYIAQRMIGAKYGEFKPTKESLGEAVNLKESIAQKYANARGEACFNANLMYTVEDIINAPEFDGGVYKTFEYIYAKSPEELGDKIYLLLQRELRNCATFKSAPKEQWVNLFLDPYNNEHIQVLPEDYDLLGFTKVQDGEEVFFEGSLDALVIETDEFEALDGSFGLYHHVFTEELTPTALQGQPATMGEADIALDEGGLVEVGTYYLPTWAVSPLMNGDVSELTNEEDSALAAFEAKFSAPVYDFHEDTREFCKTNDVDGSEGECIRCTVYENSMEEAYDDLPKDKHMGMGLETDDHFYEDGKRTTVKCTFDDGDSLVTSINTDLEGAKRYYLGKKFNMWVGGEEGERSHTCVKVEEVGRELDEAEENLNQQYLSLTEMSELGLIYKINKEILHPLGLALMYEVEDDDFNDTGVCRGCIISEDGEPFEYSEKSTMKFEDISKNITKDKIDDFLADKENNTLDEASEHEGFAKTASHIAHQEHVPEKNAAAILANAGRKSSAKAHRENPRLNKIKGESMESKQKGKDMNKIQEGGGAGYTFKFPVASHYMSTMDGFADVPDVIEIPIEDVSFEGYDWGGEYNGDCGVLKIEKYLVIKNLQQNLSPEEISQAKEITFTDFEIESFTYGFGWFFNLIKPNEPIEVLVQFYANIDGTTDYPYLEAHFYPSEELSYAVEDANNHEDDEYYDGEDEPYEESLNKKSNKSTIKESIVNNKQFKQLKESLISNNRKPVSKLSVSLFKEELKESKKSEPLKESLIMPISGFEYSVFKKGNLGEGSGKMVTQGIAMVEGQNVKVNGKSFSIKSYDFVGTKGY